MVLDTGCTGHYLTIEAPHSNLIAASPGITVLLPDGIAFSEKTTQRDWTEEKLTAIRDFYAQFTATEGATQVNLQGIQFETNGGGRLPVEKYLAALLAERLDHLVDMHAHAVRRGDAVVVEDAQGRLSLNWVEF